ncbi:hypothetical protein DJ88_4396 [Bacillus paralicheniformis]|nr:hypothetical protein DJ88_4396 [Bacillus paralicheniformis]
MNKVANRLPDRVPAYIKYFHQFVFRMNFFPRLHFAFIYPRFNFTFHHAVFCRFTHQINPLLILYVRIRSIIKEKMFALLHIGEIKQNFSKNQLVVRFFF